MQLVQDRSKEHHVILESMGRGIGQFLALTCRWIVALLREGSAPLPLRLSPELREGDLLALAGSDHVLDEAGHPVGERV